MAIYVPFALYSKLVDLIDVNTGATFYEANLIATAIQDMAIAAAESSLSQAKTHTNITESHIYTNMDTNLNLIMDYTDRQVDIIKDGLTDAIFLLQTQIEGLSGGVTDEIGEELVKSYDSIAESHSKVKDLVNATIASVGGQVTDTYNRVSKWVANELNKSLAALELITRDLLGIPQAYVDLAIKDLIPAQAYAQTATIGRILESKPVESFLRAGGDIFQSKLNEVLTIDDDELQKWITKGSEYVQGIAMQSAKPEGVP